jgi:hypothetical protein
MRVSAGEIYAQGEYRYEPGATRPHRFRLTIPELDMALFEKMAMPALSRKGSLFGFGKAPAPDWLKQLRADGTIQIDTLRAAALEFDNVHSRILWDGVHVAWPDITAAMGSGTLAARLLVDLSGRAPAYEAVTQLTGVPWKSGTVDADTVVQTSGLGADTLAHMRSTGSFAGRNVLDDYPTVTGRYNLRWSALAPSLNFTDLRLLTDSDEVLTGKASLQNDGTLLVQLANGTRQLKVNLQ